MKIVEYIILKGTGEFLSSEVKKWLVDGYVPQGGITSNHGLYAQVMVKYEEEKSSYVDPRYGKKLFVKRRLEMYRQYWNANTKRYDIEDDWKPTTEELVTDIEKAYEFERGETK